MDSPYFSLHSLLRAVLHKGLHLWALEKKIILQQQVAQKKVIKQIQETGTKEDCKTEILEHIYSAEEANVEEQGDQELQSF